MKKVIILIDGQNLFYGLKEMSVMEKNIKWDDFFQSLLEPTEELIRTYWFRPQRILDTYYTAHNIRNGICNRDYKAHYHTYRNDYPSLAPAIKSDIEKKATEVEDWIKREKKKFSEIEYNYDDLCLTYKNIEMVKSGVVKIDPFNHTYKGEKGVDIALAVKMIALSVQNKCDKIILISGDYDYAEAIRFVKDNMTKINIVKIHKGTPPINRSVSRDLAVIADAVIDVYETDIKGKFLVPQPPAIVPPSAPTTPAP